MTKKPTYAGSIKNQGSQVVKAPINAGTKAGKTKSTKGNDLRTGK